MNNTLTLDNQTAPRLRALAQDWADNNNPSSPNFVGIRQAAEALNLTGIERTIFEVFAFDIAERLGW